MGLPNYITLLRLFLVPVLGYFYLTGHFDWAMGILIVAGISDVLDGALARYLKQSTKLGTLLDPAGDKLLMAVSFFALAWMGRIPFWLFALVLGRDVYIVLGVLLLKWICKRLYVEPTILSKLNTFFQLSLLFFCTLHAIFEVNWSNTSLSWFYLSEQGLKVTIWFAALFTVLSGLQYTWIGIQVYRKKI